MSNFIMSKDVTKKPLPNKYQQDAFILDDQQIFPMCLMPPEQHYPSVEALVCDMTDYQNTRKYDNIDSIPRMTIPEGSFDKVRSGSSYVLIPGGVDYSFLFRGQGAYYPNSRPTLWRVNKSDMDVFICYLKVAEFELMLRQFPLVSYFESQSYHVDYEGLAQHYGLETAILDFTLDLNVALFFAMCDIVDDEYHPKTDDGKTYIGYLYVIFSHGYCQSMGINCPILFKEKLVPIGQQPFKRPGTQKGFSLKMQKDEPLYGYLYSFSYTAEDSRTIFKRYNCGKSLWTDDPIIKSTAFIRNTNVFSYEAVALATKRYRKLNECFSCNRMVKKLKAEGYKIVGKSKLPWHMSIPKTPLTSVEREDIERKIFFQTTYSEGKAFDKDLRIVTESDMLRLFHGSFDAPIGYESGIDFLIGKEQGTSVQSIRFCSNKLPAKPNDEGKIQLDWQKTGQQAPRTNHFIPIYEFKPKVCYVPNGVIPQ